VTDGRGVAESPDLGTLNRLSRSKRLHGVGTGCL
jgi:hypothetical protein